MGLKEQLAQWTAEVAAVQLSTADEVEAFRIQWLGRKGKMKIVMAAFKAAQNEEKRELGKLINEFKQQVEQRVAEASSQSQATGDDAPQFDWTRPGGGIPVELTTR